jgi:hypothetical protein
MQSSGDSEHLDIRFVPSFLASPLLYYMKTLSMTFAQQNAPFMHVLLYQAGSIKLHRFGER